MNKVLFGIFLVVILFLYSFGHKDEPIKLPLDKKWIPTDRYFAMNTRLLVLNWNYTIDSCRGYIILHRYADTSGDGYSIYKGIMYLDSNQNEIKAMKVVEM